MDGLKEYGMLVGGEWRAAEGNATFLSENPYTRTPWARMPRGGPTDAKAAIAAARHAFDAGPWSALTATARGALMMRLADLLDRDAHKLARVEVADNGKRLVEMQSQMNRLSGWYRYFGGLADKIEGSIPPHDNPDVLNLIMNVPLGVVVCITPWNSPLLLAAYKLAPALAAGNTVILKPSEYTSASSLEFAALFEEAGFPPGVVNVVTGYGSEIGAALVSDPGIDKVSFTGGEDGGAAVYRGAAGALHDVSLELGGKSPNIVFADCDFDNAINGVLGGIFAATGQTCVAGSRLLVERSICDRFVDELARRAEGLRMGDPMDAATQIAPVATEAQHGKILDYIKIAVEDGATCRLGGKAGETAGPGLFVEPTILTDVTNDMRIAREEVFGPVLAVIPFEHDDEAISIANDTSYGLAAGLWTKDLRRAIRMTRRLRAGTVWVNTYRQVSFMSPFGGFGRSGIGRENGIAAIREFLEPKSVWFSTAEKVASPF